MKENKLLLSAEEKCNCFATILSVLNLSYLNRDSKRCRYIEQIHLSFEIENYNRQGL